MGLDKALMNEAARRITGANMAARSAGVHALAGVKALGDHYVLKVAKMLGRALGANGTAAQELT